jgi:4-amino-4-deoxy-L-arabinose transferase-like glycosyltransferase
LGDLRTGDQGGVTLTAANRLALVLALIFAAAQTILAVAGAGDSAALCDDAFYYLQIASHAARGLGFSFDGVFPTNGFHPLLAWLQVPVFRLFGADPWIPIRVTQIGLGVATATTGYVLFRLGRAMGDDRAGLLMTSFFLLSPFTWILPQRGTEEALSVLLIALSAAFLAARRHTAMGTREGVELGALVGLACLARTDNILWAACVGLFLLWRPRRVPAILGYAAAVLLVVAPWLVWNLRQFGTIVQVSGAAKMTMDLFGRLPAITGVRQLPRNIVLASSIAGRFVVGEEFRRTYFTQPFMLASAGLLVLAVLSGGRRRLPPVCVTLGGLVVLHFVYYGWIQRSYANWYFLPVVLVAAVWQGERLARASTGLVAAMLVVSALICVGALSLFVRHTGFGSHGVERQVDIVLSELPLIPRGMSVGGWNLGARAYFGERRRPDLRFFNLDCLVNNELFTALRRSRHAYEDWVFTHVDYLIEKPGEWLPDGSVEPLGPDVARVIGRPPNR